MMRAILGWFGGKALLYLLLVLAIFAGGIGLPWARQLIAGSDRAERRILVLDRAAAVLADERDAAQHRFVQAMRQGRTRSLDELDARLTTLRAEEATLTRAIAAAPPPWRLALQGSDAVLAVQRQRLRLAWIEQEIAATVATRRAVAGDIASAAAWLDLNRQLVENRRSIAACRAAEAALRTHDTDWRWSSRIGLGSEARNRLTARRATACTQAERDVARTRRLLAIRTARHAARVAAQRRFDQAAAATARFDAVDDDLRGMAVIARTEWQGRPDQRLRLWSYRVGLSRLLKQAAIALAVIIASPFLIRLLCYFVLAPIAMRRPPVALSRGRNAAIPPAARSAPSVGVRLNAGEELLVRQSYLQTSSEGSVTTTRWLLDWRHPLTSIATGLAFLTRVRGMGEATTVSAMRDPFAEVTIVILPEGAACVLHPRALAAVAQPIARPLRVETRWRLTSLHAWLTLQLRYVVFHGPARLVVAGGRGVRVEHAGRGRVFAPDQLVGFSTDLGYAVTRTETFWPYFFGREPLLKDRVAAGEGVLIVEEAPLSARNGQVRRGIEGMVDAGMKIFGM